MRDGSVSPQAPARHRVARRWIALSWLVLAAVGCTSEAERLYEEAHRHVEMSEYDEAVTRLEQIVDRFPGSEWADKADRDLTLYRGLSSAVDFYPERRIYDQMIETARAIYRYEDRRGRWPESLERLTPDYLGETPVDPWGNSLRYAVKPNRRGYVLGCFGADGRPGGDGAARDWFIEDGRFVRRPSVGLS